MASKKDAISYGEKSGTLSMTVFVEARNEAEKKLVEEDEKKPVAEASIGRVLTVGIGRGCGLGRTLMVRALEHAAATWPETAVRIGAQTRLESFYASLGFVAIGPPYLEDGIDHTEMLRPATAGLAPSGPSPA